MNRKTTALAALLLAALTVLPACAETPAGDGAATSTAASTVAETTAAVTETGRDRLPDNVPDLDFKGDTLIILSRDDELSKQEFIAENVNGEIVNDAIYERNLFVTEKLNIKLNVVTKTGGWGSHTKFMSDVSKTILSGDDAYDIVSYYAYCNPQLAVQGLYVNLYDVPYLDLTQPWWHESYVKAATVYGKLFTLDGDISLTSTSGRVAMFFNKRLADQYVKRDLYDDVFGGKWTNELFRAIVKDLYSDLNGNSEEDVGDLYGFVGHGYDQYLTGEGYAYTEAQADGSFKWIMNTEKNAGMIEDFYNMIGEKGVFYDDKTNTQFEQKQAVFQSKPLSFAPTTLRDFEDEFGILPMPKYDEAQEKYYSMTRDEYSQMSIPVTCGDKKLAGAAMELMCAESYRKVTPAYFEVAMKEKYLRDTESAQVYDILLAGARYDFAVINTSILGDPVFITRNSAQHKNGSFASQWAANASALEAKLTAALETYKKL